MRGVYGCLVIAVCIGVSACSLVLDPSEHGSGPNGPDGDGGQQADGGGHSNDAAGPDLTDAGQRADASDPFLPPEGCEDPDVDEACMAIDCGRLADPQDGEVTTPDGTTFGQAADYTCDAGYGVVGVSRRTCQANGAWSDEAPRCEPGDCLTLQSPDNGVVTTLDGTSVDDVAIYSCNNGYALVGEDSRTCRADGSWSGSAASCAIRDCGTPSQPANGSASANDGTSYGDVATYDCDTGYALSGGSEATCSADGTWANPPSCPPADECATGDDACGEGSCVGGAGYGYGCSCNLGYMQDSSAFPTCVAVPVLSADASAHAFEARERGTESAYFDWEITNIGAAASGALTIDSDNEDDFELDDGCDSSLEPGESCTIRVRFAPLNYGSIDGNLSATSYTGDRVTLDVSGESQVRITVASTGTGTLTGDNGISCPGTCSALFDYGSNVTLHAHTTNGSGHFLSHWSVADCRGPSRDCVVYAGGSMTVTATFSPMTHNLVFASSEIYPADLGGTAAYEARCNQLATAAGINNAGGNGYVAAISDSSSLFTDRLGDAVRGWVRLDGRPFATTQATLEELTLHPVRFDERGNDLHYDEYTWNGHSGSGVTPTITCLNWTSTAEDERGAYGHPHKGPFQWLYASNLPCSYEARVVCLGNTQTAALSVGTTSGKKIWVSNDWRPGRGVTPEERCFADRPPGSADGVPFMAFTDRTAASVIDVDANYVRPDGQLVGTGQQLIDMDLYTGVWQDGDGAYTTYLGTTVWTGAYTPNDLGTNATTCDNWTSMAGDRLGMIGDSDHTIQRHWSTFGSAYCVGHDPAFTMRIYCVEP